MAAAIDALKVLGTMFYAVDPRETSFKTVDAVPDYISAVIPFFYLSIVVEFIAAQFSAEHRAVRLNDGFGSIASGVTQQLAYKFGGKAMVVYSYSLFYQHFHLVDLDPLHLSTWLLGFVCIDLGYYFAHRAGHELNFFWATHVPHHSSEDYNLTTALRQGFVQALFSWLYYLPFALVLPPSVFVVHSYFNTLYQFWIHTELIGKLGPIEWILNTPSHHRVHHGRNPYCIDKNYGGTLIIWDRLFGTFAEERDDERVVFGITHPLNTFDQFTVQTHQFIHIAKSLYSTPGLVNKFKVLFYGPGWAEGKPRLGLESDIPKVNYPFQYYDPKIPFHLNVYVLVQFAIVLAIYSTGLPHFSAFSGLVTTAFVGFVMFSLTSFGKLFDRKPEGAYFEVTRQIVVALGIWFLLPLADLLAPEVLLVVQYAATAVSTVSVALIFVWHSGNTLYGNDKREFSLPPTPAVKQSDVKKTK